MAGHRSTVRRFASAEIDTSRAVGLRADHPALSEGRTIFPSSVTPSRESPRFLISGHNNPKLGKTVLKGPRAGWPIYQLSLEERATCPRSCAVWSECYGNAMPYARRHTPDEQFERFLVAEMITLCRAHPEGLLVRLHALGDFYSVEYVYIWARLIADFPQLHVFGYTARRTDDADPETAKIAQAIALLTEGAWDRFAIRSSGADAPARSLSIVVDQDPDLPNVIVCPAQTEATEACASCGLCWAEAARDKTVAFLRHGMKRRPAAANDEGPAPITPPKARVIPNRRPKAAGTVALSERVLAYLDEKGIPLKPREIADHLAADYFGVTKACAALFTEGRAIYGWGPIENGKRGKLLSPIGEAAADTPVSPRPAPDKLATSPIRITTTVAPRAVTRDPAAPSADDLPDLPANDTRPRSLNARKPGQCAYPTNNPAPGRGEDTEYCCAPVAGKLQYCEAHARAMWPSRKAAA